MIESLFTEPKINGYEFPFIAVSHHLPYFLPAMSFKMISLYKSLVKNALVLFGSYRRFRRIAS